MSEEDIEDIEVAIAEATAQPLPTRIWEQWPEEPDEWYANFLIYLTLGRGRTIDAAYKHNSITAQRTAAAVSGMERDIIVPGKASATWWRQAAMFRWEDRAARHDVYVLSQLVPQTVTAIFEVIGEFAKVTMEQLRSGEVRPENWREIKESVDTLASYISPEIIQATVAHSRSVAIESGELADQDE